MKKNSILCLLTVSTLLFVTGCGEPDKKEEEKTSGFKTKRSSFLAVLDKKNPTKENRNAYMDEFISASDLQCQQYLSKSLEPASTDSKKDNSLYMTVIDTASTAMGVKTITDAAKQIYESSSEDTKKETKSAYAKALSPEIKRGVEVARVDYAQSKMYPKKNRLIESYTYENLEQDLKNYDKLCNHEVGLVEINKALKKMQSKPTNTPTPFTSKVVIDPAVIAKKVDAVNKEAEGKINKTVPKEGSDLNTTSTPVL